MRAQKGAGAKALEFAILTAARSGEVLGATWGEIDTQERVWTIPGGRMQAGREHRVPLSEAALAVLEAAQSVRTVNTPDAYVFPGAVPLRGLSVMALDMLLRRMNKTDDDDAPPPWRDADGRAATPHGFRSAFRDWAAETTAYPREVAEMALAHAVGDKVEAAYRRGDLFDKRARLMDDWATHCAQVAKVAGDNVTPIRSGERRATT
jgi:integrase